ncbi:hypothetical protein BGX33_004434, partial [Mortierella sp. NVP41]
HKANPESGYNDVAMESSLSLVEGGSITKEPPIKFHNLAVNQKAVYQPTLKHRRWLQKKKDEPISENESIASIEFDLPPRRGPDASIKDYTEKLKEVGTQLDAFYNNTILKKNLWNARRARDEEFKLVATRLLGIVGGPPGAKRKDDQK